MNKQIASTAFALLLLTGCGSSDDAAPTTTTKPDAASTTAPSLQIDDVWARRFVLDGLGIVEGVAAVLQVAAVARFPELLVRHAPYESLENGTVESLRVGYNAA